MTSPAEGRELVRYLLGDLSEEEAAHIEKRMFEDDECFDTLVALENQLFDDYVQGLLLDSQRAQFKRRLSMLPAWQHAVPLTQSLVEELARARTARAPKEDRPPGSREGISWSAVRRWQLVGVGAAIALLATASVWLGMIAARQRQETATARAEQASTITTLQRELADQRQRVQDIEQTLAQERAGRSVLEQALADRRPSEPTSVTFLLALGSVRDFEQFQRVVIPTAVQVVRLRFDLPPAAEAGPYRITIRTVEGLAIWGGVRPSAADGSHTVEAELSAPVLTGGQYVATLQRRTTSGQLEDVGSASFLVIRR